LVFSDYFDLPLAETVKVQSFHGEEVISTSWWGDHHDIAFDDSVIKFQINSDKSRLHVTASNGAGFNPPCVENWIGEALTFINAQINLSKDDQTHFEKDTL
jgi:hypothetical protein